ncbi:MAG: hypothetical protein E7030_09305 [Akkermansiaceae bacterium]|nr:hypothetical protein [Akkermansiaceae bacterium]
MAKMHTWLKLLAALLIIPMVAVGGAVKICTCHHELVQVGGHCECGHAHMQAGEKHAPTPKEHRCAHVENEMQPVSAQVQVPVFTTVEMQVVELPNFQWCLSRMHSMVALCLERAALWDPPNTRISPLLI